MACLDTTVLIALQRRNTEYGGLAARKVVELVIRGESLATSRLCAAELYVGVELARDRERELESVRRVLDGLEILPLDDRAAWLFAKAVAHLRRIGRPSGDVDVLIAAMALANGHCLVTRNPSHFADIPHLRVEAY
jgi:tRNA(fMet)-specific endonuclease VapC